MSKNHYAINYVTDLQGPFLGLCEPAPLRRMSILNYFSLSHIPVRQVKKVIFRGIIEGFLTDSSVIVRPASVAQLDAHLTGDQEVAGSTLAEVGNIPSWRLIMKYFLWSFSPFR